MSGYAATDQQPGCPLVSPWIFWDGPRILIFRSSSYRPEVRLYALRLDHWKKTRDDNSKRRTTPGGPCRTHKRRTTPGTLGPLPNPHNPKDIQRPTPFGRRRAMAGLVMPDEAVLIFSSSGTKSEGTFTAHLRRPHGGVPKQSYQLW